MAERPTPSCTCTDDEWCSDRCRAEWDALCGRIADAMAGKIAKAITERR